jgi:hypothetical protein
MTTQNPTPTLTNGFIRRVKVCPTCKTDDFTSTKNHSPDFRSNFQTHFCHRCRVGMEPVWVCSETYGRHGGEHPVCLLERAQNEVARLTKMLKRYEAVQDARDAALAATLTEAVEQSQQDESDATAADFYGSFGRDEWPTR